MGSVTTGVLDASPVPNSANTISVILVFSMGIFNATCYTWRQYKPRKFGNKKMTCPLQIFPFLCCKKNNNKKPDQNWSQIGRRGSGAKYNLQDLWSPQGRSQYAFFNPCLFLTTPDCQTQTSSTPKATLELGMLTWTPTQGSKETESSPPTTQCTTTKRFNRICLKSHIFNTIVTFWQ